ncbi:MAG: diguanylate cyclase [Gammaproteobacteria bacterium]|nr:diguanylate cyclase [Gammaproteobacteria bacterium]
MQWFYNLKILTKLILAFLFLLGLSGFIGVYALEHLGKVKYVSTEIELDWLPSIVASANINNHIDQFRIAEVQHVLSTSEEDRRSYEQELDKQLNKITTAQHDYQRLISIQEEEKLYQNFVQAWDAYLKVHAQIIVFSLVNKDEEAWALLRGESQQRFNEMTQHLDKLAALNIKGGVEASRRGDRLYESARVLIVAALVVSLVLGLALAVVISGYISRRLKALDGAARRMAAGDLDVEIAATSQDELGSLAVSLQRAVENTRAMVNKLREARRESASLEYQATHDPLTKLPNRVFLYTQAGQLMQAGQRKHDIVGLLLMDLDSFKEINDLHGHQIGDLLLEQVAERLVKALRESDTVARLGGDEFVALLPGIDLEGVIRCAEKILKALEVKFVITGLILKTSISIGIALWPEHGADIGSLMRCADRSMYKAKQTHSGYWVCTSEERDKSH